MGPIGIDDVDVDALGWECELEKASELGGSHRGCLVVVVERHLLELDLESLEIHAGERADSGVFLTNGKCFDVEIGDVADICVTWKDREC